MKQSPSWGANTHSVKKLPSFYGTQSFITEFTTARHWSPSWITWIQSATPHPVTLRWILILSSYLCLGLQSGLFLPGFPTKIFTHFSSLPCLLHPRPSHPHCDQSNNICWTYMLWCYLLCSLLHPPVSSSLSPNILLSTLFSNIYNLWPFLSVTDQGSHPYRTTGTNIILYIFMTYRPMLYNRTSVQVRNWMNILELLNDNYCP
jgi:hypothetical protein